MDKITVSEDARQRILENIEKEMAQHGEIPDIKGAGKKNSRRRIIRFITFYGSRAAVFMIIAVGAFAVIKTVGLKSTQESSAPQAVMFEEPQTTEGAKEAEQESWDATDQEMSAAETAEEALTEEKAAEAGEMADLEEQSAEFSKESIAAAETESVTDAGKETAPANTEIADPAIDERGEQSVNKGLSGSNQGAGKANMDTSGSGTNAAQNTGVAGSAAESNAAQNTEVAGSATESNAAKNTEGAGSAADANAVQNIEGEGNADNGNNIAENPADGSGSQDSGSAEHSGDDNADSGSDDSGDDGGDDDSGGDDSGGDDSGDDDGGEGDDRPDLPPHEGTDPGDEYIPYSEKIQVESVSELSENVGYNVSEPANLSEISEDARYYYCSDGTEISYRSILGTMNLYASKGGGFTGDKEIDLDDYVEVAYIDTETASVEAYGEDGVYDVVCWTDGVTSYILVSEDGLSEIDIITIF